MSDTSTDAPRKSFASRALGSRLASFVALIEVLFSLLFGMVLLACAWALEEGA